MMARFDRLHVTLAVLIALGVGFRAISNRRDRASPDQPALTAHIDGLPSRRERPKPVRPREKKSRTAKADTTAIPAVRVERSPPGARASAQGPSPYGNRPVPIDLDRASVEELERLPGIGPSMAKRLLADRQGNGPFGSLEGLQRVKGIGPRLAARLAPHVTFGDNGRPSNVISTQETAGAGSQSGSRRRGGRTMPHSR